MVSATIIVILIVFTYMMWRRYSQYNRRQMAICEQTFHQLLSKARAAGESEVNVKILINLTIDTYNESLRGPWFYKKLWKIPQQTFMVKKNETERHTKRGHSDSESDISEG